MVIPVTDELLPQICEVYAYDKLKEKLLCLLVAGSAPRAGHCLDHTILELGFLQSLG